MTQQYLNQQYLNQSTTLLTKQYLTQPLSYLESFSAGNLDALGDFGDLGGRGDDQGDDLGDDFGDDLGDLGDKVEPEVASDRT